MVSTVSLDGEPLGNTFSSANSPTIGALYLTDSNCAKRVSNPTNLIGHADQLGCRLAIYDLYIYPTSDFAEMGYGIDKCIEHTFDYKVGV